jgi:hypothetical protein
MNESNDCNYWDLIEHAHNTVNICDGPDVFLREFAALAEPERHLLAAHWFYSEHTNGGLHQFFANPTGVLAPEAVIGLRAIGLPGVADLLQEAMDRAATPYPRGRAERAAIIGSWPDPMSFEDIEDRMPAAYGNDPPQPEPGVWTSAFDQAADAYARSRM